MVVVLLYRANLPRTVITRPWHVRVNGSPKLPEELQFLLLAEHHLASGGTLKLKDEFGFLTLKLVLDLPSHPIEPCCEFLLVFLWYAWEALKDNDSALAIVASSAAAGFVMAAGAYVWWLW